MKDDAKKQQERSSCRKQHRSAVILLIYTKMQEKLLSLNNPINHNPEEEAQENKGNYFRQLGNPT